MSYLENNISSCFWKLNSNSCEKNIRYINYDFWFEPYLKCESTKKYFITQKEYCYNSENTKLPFEGKINKKNGIYGIKNIYCLWNIADIKSERDIEIKININKFNSYDYFFIKIIYTNNSDEILITEKKKNKFIKKNIQKIIIRYLSKEEKSYNPFKINIKYRFENEKLIYYAIVIGIMILLFLIIYILFWCNGNRITHSKKSKKNIFDFSKYYTEHKYNESLNLFKTDCMICLTKFKNDEIVLKLVCNHIFHKKCLEKWLNEKKKEKKCPNCNLKLEEILKLKNKIDPFNREFSFTRNPLTKTSHFQLSNERIQLFNENLIHSMIIKKKKSNQLKENNNDEILRIRYENNNEDKSDRRLNSIKNTNKNKN